MEVALAGATEIMIVNRSAGRGEELTTLLDDKLPVSASFIPWEKTFTIPSGTDVLINATSIGLFPDLEARLDLDLDSLSPDTVVADVIPNPPDTNLVRMRPRVPSYRWPGNACQPEL